MHARRWTLTSCTHTLCVDTSTRATKTSRKLWAATASMCTACEKLTEQFMNSDVNKYLVNWTDINEWANKNWKSIHRLTKRRTERPIKLLWWTSVRKNDNYLTALSPSLYRRALEIHPRHYKAWYDNQSCHAVMRTKHLPSPLMQRNSYSLKLTPHLSRD